MPRCRRRWPTKSKDWRCRRNLPRVVDFQAVEEFGSEPIGIQGWPAGNYMFREIKIVEGRICREKIMAQVGHCRSGTGQTEVGQSRRKPLIGGSAAEKYHIVGIFESVADMENGMVVMLLDDAQKVLGKTGLITGCTVKVKDNERRSIAAIEPRDRRTRLPSRMSLKGKLRAKPPGDS